MNTVPIVPATLACDDRGIPYSAEYRDIYHPKAGASTQARHVFLGGNQLPSRWQDRDRFVVLETGFGLGNNFLATWQAWRDDPQRCARLCFISIEKHPLSRDDLTAAHRQSQLPDLVAQLIAAWPPLTHNLHSLVFEEGRVELMLALGDVQAWLPEIVASVDAFYLDGFAPATNPQMWDERVCKALGRLAAPGATLATWSAAHAMRQHLTTAGFDVRLGQGTGGKRDITLATFAPRFEPRKPRSRALVRPGTQKHAVIVGGGLAGCAAAWALAEQGWSSTLLERRPHVAAEASGNPAGLFHGIVNAQDGLHARFNRAAALVAAEAVRIAIERFGAAGRVDGLLRLDTAADVGAMKSMLERLGLPGHYVEALDAAAVSSTAGIALDRPAWFYPAGGWVDPAALARSFLQRAGDKTSTRVDAEVDALRQIGDGWQLIDREGAVLAEAQTVVLANASDALRLLGNPDWPVESIRGQLSMSCDSALMNAAPRLPIAGSGYLLPTADGRLMFGATSQPGDTDASVRDADHAANIAQLGKLLGCSMNLQPSELEGRTAWRFSSRDRLPIIGAMPAPLTPGNDLRLDQPRLVPRMPGLFVFTALGSRGITWSALGAKILASQITGSPSPVEASLLDAVDPARYVSRRARRADHARAGAPSQPRSTV